MVLEPPDHDRLPAKRTVECFEGVVTESPRRPPKKFCSKGFVVE